MASPVALLEKPKSLVQLFSEYVAGGNSGWIDNYKRTLPKWIDDATENFGDDLYERMMLDSQVSSGVNVVILGTMAQGITFINPKDQGDEAYDEAEDIRQFILRCVNRLPKALEDTATELLQAVAVGNKIAEKIYELAVEGEDKGKLVIKNIKVRPRNSVAFLVDPYMNIEGIVGLKPGFDGMTIGTDYMFQTTEEFYSYATLLPRDKFMVFSWRPKNEDPRGTSIIRAAYGPWWMKLQLWPEFMKYLTQFASPSLLGFTPEHAFDTAQTDGFGNPILDDVGDQITITPEQAMLNILLQFVNSSAAVFPFGSLVQPIEMQGNGEAFRLAIAQLDEQITKAILYQTLATGEGQHQARAASETHQDILDVLIRYAKLAIARCLETDFVYDLVKFNFGEDAARNLAPQVVLPNSEIQDFPGRAAAVATLHSTEFFADDQMASLDAMLGLKQRNMKNWLALKDEQRQLEKDKAMKPMGGPGGAKRPLGGVASGITDPDSRGPSAGKIGDKT